MARKVIMPHIQLDDEVAELVKRIGVVDQPGNFIKDYTIARNYPGPTLVTVTFMADEQFSVPAPTPLVVTEEKESH